MMTWKEQKGMVLSSIQSLPILSLLKHLLVEDLLFIAQEHVVSIISFCGPVSR